MESPGNYPSPKAQPRTPPRPRPQTEDSSRTGRPWGSPPGSRPPVPKKPPIAHVKPLLPRGNSSPGTPPDPKGSPRSHGSSPGGVPGKVPPPLPKVPPKGGSGISDSPPVAKKGTVSPAQNGSISKGIVPRVQGGISLNVSELTTQNGSENDSETTKSPDSLNSSIRKPVGDLSNATDSDIGDLSLNAASSFFDEVMSAISQNHGELTVHVHGEEEDQGSAEVKTGEESKTKAVCSVEDKTDEISKDAVFNGSEKANVSPSKPLVPSPPIVRPKPMKRLSLTTHAEGSPRITDSSVTHESTPSERPAIKPKPVPRKRLPMPNLSRLENIESPSAKTTSNDELDGTNITSEDPPDIPTKSQARIKGRLSLDTYFQRPNLSLDFQQCESPLSSSFDYSDSDDTPRRPPRPRRKKTLQGSPLCHSASVDTGSKSLFSKENNEIPDRCDLQNVSPFSPKVPPTKPKRKTIPRVNRSLSDVSATASFIDHVDNQKDAKCYFLSGQTVHSPVDGQGEPFEGRRRSQTSEAIMSPLPSSSSSYSPLRQQVDQSHEGARFQRVNPFNKDSSPVSEKPDFHSEVSPLNTQSTKRPADVLSPILPNKNNKMPLVKLKPTRKAPPPPVFSGGHWASSPHPKSLPKKELNNNKPETAQCDLNDDESTQDTSDHQTVENDYEIVPQAKDKGVKVSSASDTNNGNPENCSGDLPGDEAPGSVPVVPPRAAVSRKSVLDITPPPPPCAPPRTRKADGNLEEDDGYIYPEDVPVEFAESKLWPKNKITRPQSAFVGSSESSKVELNELTGSPRAIAKYKHLSLMSEASSQSDHSSDGPQRTSSFLFSRSSSEDSMCDGDGPEGKGKKREKLYYIVEEIVNSEKVFVDVLKLLNVDFRLAVSAATEKAGKPIIAADILNRILNFLPQLQNFNEDLLKDFTERLENWDEERKVADIFVKKGPFLKLYTSYIKNFEQMTELFIESCKKNPPFAAVVKEFEHTISHCDLSNRKGFYYQRSMCSRKTPKCASLALQHYMLKPIQRIPQYRLLLQDYKKHLAQDSPDYKDTNTALSIVSEVADHANESMRYGDTVQKLLSIQHSLIGQFEVIKPGRVLIKEGELLKLSRKEMQPRMFFLFSDVLLYTTPQTGGFKLNNVLPLTNVKVGQEDQEDYKNEFSIISVQRSFTLATRTAEEKEEWLKALQSAIKEHVLKRSTFDFGRHSSQPDLNRDFTLGSKAPVWIPDSRVTMCMMCTVEFTVTWRRHHCRACGKVVCGSCSENRAPLQYLDYKVGRVCDDCFDKLHDDVEERSKSLGRGEALDSEGSTGLSISGLKARFMKIRRSARTLRGSGAKRRPAVLKEVHANDQGSTLSGYLKHQKGKKWRKLWFVLKDKVLYAYKASKDMAAIESYPLLGYDVVKMTEPYDGVEPGLVFQCKHKNTDPLIFRTDNPAITDKWVEMMRAASIA